MTIKNIISKILNNFYLRQIILAVLITLFIIFITFQWLKIYTNHNKTIETPDLYGLSIEEASKVLHKHKLQFKITDSVFQSQSPRGKLLFCRLPNPIWTLKKTELFI